MNTYGTWNPKSDMSLKSSQLVENLSRNYLFIPMMADIPARKNAIKIKHTRKPLIFPS